MSAARKLTHTSRPRFVELKLTAAYSRATGQSLSWEFTFARKVVEYLAPDHCTGEPAFTALKKVFGDHSLYAVAGTTLMLTASQKQEIKKER
jgi:hypothetical protein